MNPRRIAAHISRLGTDATVLVVSDSGTTNAFNNPEPDYTEGRTVTAVRTYPNRNTEVEASGGTYHRDRPVFLFPRSDGAADPPGEDDRLKYNGRVYEMQAPTYYDTHVEMFGEVVREADNS